MKQCKIDGCDRKHHALGWCNMHYRRWHDTGDLTTTIVRDKRETLDSIAADYRAGRLGDECIPAPGCRTSEGYGHLRVDGRHYGAHNYVLRQAVGPPPPDKPEAAHNCTTKDCVSPKHLEWKSAKENAADKKRDGTLVYGERSHKAKLTAPDVLEILRLYATNNYTYETLGEMYGVNYRTIHDIVMRKTWKHVAMPEDT
jgi:hypothetical protein